MSTINNSLNSPSLSNISVANNSVLVTDGSGVGSLSTTIPSATQANITIAESQVTNLVSDLASKAALASPTFTGTVTLPIILIKEVQNPLISNKTPSNITATTATLTNIQMAGGVITLNPTLAQALTLPTGSDMDSIYNSPSTNRGGTVRFINQSSVASTFTANTGFSLSGCYLTAGFVVIPANSAREFDICCQGTANYVLFG